jgi:hypothetical protein
MLLFLLYIGILIFAEKIFDNHHAYNRRSEITSSITKILSNLIESTCLISAIKLLWLSYHLIFINKIRRSIVLAIKKSTYLYYNALSNKFPKYKAGWNVVKMNRSGKCESEIFFLHQLLISRIYACRFEIT